ncbi:hypothetical protein [Deinococcus wulumuqiensis]|uniref:Malate synthase N-terminal domain-containing protein n=1 Tax=Deinococcus wulumuqiensis TaxID=980427 RepID=A0AAV4K6U7_9DEIO|nr:hypothetical protein [Deinococcus wulumuqiensis]GGI84451.1 hypothetical protein GCM10010914_18530 [Deinococcus wulumuqiensis]GGP29790.1 hypothetical protein GCM10008021_14410 [Deinococcus wulumuqiensis]
MTELKLPAGMTITTPVRSEYAEILTPEALAFVAELHRRFEARRRELMESGMGSS